MITQENHCIYVSISSNLPIMHRVYVPLTVLTSVFYMAWYKIVMQRSLVEYHGEFLLSLVFSWYTHEPLAHIENTSDRDIPLESVS